ncbi:polysaccharide biosynthesis protein [Hanamia caeni]|jgi:FlaA1/EpsC-like NDP-sugar epimerase|uniref:Polysaccharide biosynthesis protein n=1 Tax=Hanamia caeni TaxID=2294116 RepID=A0A3M9NBN3_9BACT|nr:nucleoside-diphosphate sugar epimerase/dehydratase [Hanamia caeni]RNI35194.1 polysaccharide biosynthesis protein [Hanamia caeni]
MLEKFFKNKYAPRWIIFCFDLILVTSAFIFSYFLRHLFLDIKGLTAIVPAALLNTLIFGICVLFFPIYKGIIRYSEINDIFRIVKFASLQLVLWLAVFAFGVQTVISDSLHVPFLITNFFSVIFILVLFRLMIKEVYSKAALSKSLIVSRAIIYGAGEMGQVTKQILEQDLKNKTVVLGFIEDSPSKIGKNLGGLPIYKASGARLSALLKQKQVTDVYIAIDKLSVEKKIAITDVCSPLNIKINVIPHVSEWRGGFFEKKQVKELNIEDLLERDEISLPYEMVQDAYKESTILVTGAAGSIGSEICRQLAKFTFKKLVLLDQSESGLFDLEYELRTSKNRQQLRVEVASIRDAAKLKKVFTMHKPDFVFHAAAYKHVPLMETFTSEAVLTNIFGTKIVADLAMAFKVKKFVMVSTDKAVNPSNVMGTTKRISEIYIQSLSDRPDSQTAFITTRFGNVLGSAGSVVRTFNKQIKAGGPITITHPEITRYFMTIPEASKLVLEAGKIGESGDILLFDMGEPVKIMDLAKRMIQLAGLKPTDIAIVQTGLRPGEKMYEELFKDSEEFAETYHPRILRAKKSPNVNGEFNNLMNELREVALMHNNEMIPFILRKMVPEFTSSTGALSKVVSEKELESLKN